MKKVREFDKVRHSRAPLFEALKKHIEEKIIPFHVPGHKHGHGIPELLDFMGENALAMDVNAMRDLDDLGNPISVIEEAHKLTADAFGADHAYFLVNGTTSGIHTMMLSAVTSGETIILPRNSHKSVYTGIIISGAVPFYSDISFDKKLGIATALSYEKAEEAIKKVPHAQAIILMNPSYYGFASDLKKIVKLAHEHDMIVLVDEAHGCHLDFHEEFPISAMEAGADISALSAHKTGGALTQSSYLLMQGKRVSRDILVESMNFLMTTSASYLLMASLDLARKQLVLKGRSILAETLYLAREARRRINEIEGLYAFGKELSRDGKDIYAFDDTKLGIYVRELGMSGFEMEMKLRNEFRIQVEFADFNNILALVTIGDKPSNIDALVDALKKIASNSKIQHTKEALIPPEFPPVIVSPRDATYSSKKFVDIQDANKEISGEMVMIYPPGIPLICPGEKITQDIIEYIKILKSQNCLFHGMADPHLNKIRVLGN